MSLPSPPRIRFARRRLHDRLGGLCWIAFLALIPFLHAPATSAQDLDSDGLWWSAGAGVGWNRIGCDVCRGDLDGGPVGTVALGTTLRRGLLLGAEGGVWTRQAEDEARQHAVSVSAVAFLYPRTDRRVFLKGGAGWVRYWIEDFRYNAVGVKIGAGYAQPVAGRITLIPSLEILGSAFGSLLNEDDLVTDRANVSEVRLTLSVQGR